jgi:alpha-ketoglutarate-dependent 2,4-dichlorophenoxyacetate dioxygenase
MRLTPLHPLFGVEVHEVDLRSLRADSGYAEIRAAFEEHSLLLFRQQALDDEAHLALGALFGPIEDRSMGGDGPRPRMANVSNRLESGAISPPDSAHTLELMANQLWHTDSTFLPVPALANILAARVLSSSGGETELASTRVGWRELPQVLRTRVQSAVFRHRFAHSRAKVSRELATGERYTRWKDQAWKAVWRNPVNGEDALYIASHVCAVDGLDEQSGAGRRANGVCDSSRTDLYTCLAARRCAHLGRACHRAPRSALAVRRGTYAREHLRLRAGQRRATKHEALNERGDRHCAAAATDDRPFEK